MPQCPHKSAARRSERVSPYPYHHHPKHSTAPSRRAPSRPLQPNYLSQAERSVIESWKQDVCKGTATKRREDQAAERDAVVQAYLATKLRLFQMSLAKQQQERARSDTASTSSTRS